MPNKKIIDIKDKTPSEDVIKLLEKLLEKAKSGDLRSALVIQGYADDTFIHEWSIDVRTGHRRFLADLVMAQYDLATKIALREGDSVLANALNP